MTEGNKLSDTKKLMGALMRMKPKPHEDMKLGKANVKRHKSPRARKPNMSRPAK